VTETWFKTREDSFPLPSYSPSELTSRIFVTPLALEGILVSLISVSLPAKPHSEVLPASSPVPYSSYTSQREGERERERETEREREIQERDREGQGAGREGVTGS
jgi:hypothetical protein